MNEFVGERPQEYQLWIDGAWASSSNSEKLSSKNPFDGKVWATATIAGSDNVDAAVAAARKAFVTWGGATAAFRANLLRQLAHVIEANIDMLSEVQVRENGRLLREVRGQTAHLANAANFWAGAAETIRGETIPVSIPNMVNYTTREPIGVVAAITPWNSPLALLMWKLGPALAAGNCLVVKPSEMSPVSTLVFAELMTKAGFPPGVINVVVGASEVGSWLVNHPGVDKIAFTGSTGTGKKIAAQAAERLARVSLELGGKSPNIVFADAALDNAVEGVVGGIFGAAGQACLAGSRALIQESIYDRFVEALLERTSKIRLGDPADLDTDMGPIACEPQFNKILAMIETGKAEGAVVLAGGGRPGNPALYNGLFVAPTVFGDVLNEMRIAQEEIFGPVLVLIRFSTEEEAVAIANNTRFGLAAGVWTNDIKRAHRMSRSINAGTIWVNTYRRTSYASPFGGMKDSGIGRENGLDGLREYTETKSIWIDLGEGVKDPFNPRA